MSNIAEEIKKIVDEFELVVKNEGDAWPTFVEENLNQLTPVITA